MRESTNMNAPQPVRKRLGAAAATLQRLLKRLGGCTPQLDCGADRKSVASQRCRDTGGQPFDSAPTTSLSEGEREAIETAAFVAEWFSSPNADILRSLLKRLK